ncbi:MAG: hypothetical protein R2826_04980 [Thermoleophilia bacterium]
MDIGKCAKDAWGLFRIDLGPLIAAALIAAVVWSIAVAIVGLAVFGGVGLLGDISRGVAFGSTFLGVALIAVIGILVYAWLYAVVFHMMLRRVREARPADYADLRDFDQIGSFAVAGVVLGVIIAIGYSLLVIPGLFLTTIWLYSLPLIGDRRLALSDAMGTSKDLASAPGLFTTFATWLVGAVIVGVVIGILQVIPVIGGLIGLLALPFGVGYVVSMYFQALGEGHLVTQAVERATLGDR